MKIQLEDLAERGLTAPLDVSTSVDLAEFDPERTQTHYVLQWLTVDLPEAGSKPNDLSQHAA